MPSNQSPPAPVQEQALILLRERGRSLTELSCAMGLNRLATSSVLRALERKGLAQYAPPTGDIDQWSRGNWYAKEKQ